MSHDQQTAAAAAPTVTVVCRTYNHRPYIAHALEGFARQRTSFPFEVLVVDDASTDGTTDIVRDYAARYPGVVIPIIMETNLTLAGRNLVREVILPRVRGEFVALCEGDDCWCDPRKLEIQVEAMRSHPGVDICAHTSALEKDGAPAGFHGAALRDKVLAADSVIKGSGDYVCTCTLMVRREQYLDWTPMREAFTYDFTLQIQASLRGGMLFLARTMAIRRLRTAGSWSVRMRGAPMAGVREQVRGMLRAADSLDSHRHHRAFRLAIGYEEVMDMLVEKRYFDLLRPGIAGIALSRLARHIRTRIRRIMVNILHRRERHSPLGPDTKTDNC